MKKQPFFSVVIPAYNAELFLRIALECVQAQTFKDYELIVVDNGSVDQTYKIAKSFLEKSGIKYKIVHVNSNIGIGPGRNLGIKNSTGKYVAFLDADDVWYPEKLSKVHEAFMQHPDCDLVCHDEDFVFNNKKIGLYRYGPWKENMYESLLFNGNCLSGSATVVKKEKLVAAGLFSIDMRFNGVEDYELWLRLSKVCKFYFLHETLGVFIASGTNTSNNVEKQVKQELNVLDYYFSKMDKDKKDTTRIQKRYASVYLGTGWFLHRRGMFSESRKWYKKAIERFPKLYKAYGAIMLSFLRIKW